MKKYKKEVFRPNDLVRIVNPEFFVRVGYPFDKQYAIDNLISDEEKSILLKLLGNPDKNVMMFNSQWNRNQKVYFEMLDRLAYYKLTTYGFGGHTRSIFTEKKEEFKDRKVRVLNKRVVKTGIRDSHSEYNDWTGESYGIPYLGQEKSHVLLEIDLLSKDGNFSFGPFSWIEEKNVEKVKTCIEQ